MEPCKWDTQMGKIIEFIDNIKGLRVVLGGIVVAILVQVGAFLFMWGGLTTTVKTHDEAIHNILAKLEKVKFVGVASAEMEKK